MTEAQSQTSRKQPKQTRSRRTVGKILDAAARVFAEAGYEGATTNRIAEVAGVSVGSLYQFFPNKGALLHALQREWLARVENEMGAALSLEPARSLEMVIAGVITAFETLDRERPGMLRVLGSHYAGEVPTPDVENVHRAVAGQVERFLAAHAPSLPGERRPAVAALCVHVCDGLFELGTPVIGGFDPAVAREVRAALLAYLGPWLAG